MDENVYFLEEGRIRVEKLKIGHQIMYSIKDNISIGIYFATTEEEKDKKIKEIKGSLGKKSLDELFSNHK